MRGNPRIIITDLTDDVQISYRSDQSIISAGLCMRRVSVKFVSKLYSSDQEHTKLSFAQDPFDCVENVEKFFKTFQKFLSSCRQEFSKICCRVSAQFSPSWSMRGSQALRFLSKHCSTQRKWATTLTFSAHAQLYKKSTMTKWFYSANFTFVTMAIGRILIDRTMHMIMVVLLHKHHSAEFNNRTIIRHLGCIFSLAFMLVYLRQISLLETY